MIIQNGTIELKQKTGGGINPDTGFPNKLYPKRGASLSPVSIMQTSITILGVWMV
jgi:hypothetical protein